MSELQICDYGVSRRRVPFHLSELGCQDPDFIGPICSHGVYKAVNVNRHNVLDVADMFLQKRDFRYPRNFLRGGISRCDPYFGEITHYEVIIGNIRKDFTVVDVIV